VADGEERADPEPRPPELVGSRIVLTAAGAVVLLAGLSAARELVVTVLVAALLAVVCSPVVHRLHRLGLPAVAAVGLLVLALLVVFVGMSGVVITSIAEFEAAEPGYVDQLDALARRLSAWLEIKGVTPAGGELLGARDVLRLIGDIVSSIVGVLSNAFVVLFLVAFMLLEVQGFPDKLRRALGDPDADLAEFRLAVGRIHGYLSTKSWVNLLTGIVVGLVTWGAGVNFPVLWGLVAFLFNYVPTLGSVLAAVPPLLLALAVQGPGPAAGLAVVYLIVNIAIGYVLEPRLLSRKLGLSPLVILLSLMLWSVVLGPVGMVLSVPITATLKIALEHTRDLRFAAALLGPGEPPPGSRSQRARR
jgi:predicted PurR-regulated permease PerM